MMAADVARSRQVRRERKGKGEGERLNSYVEFKLV
jgi:hypothetical protein